MHLLPTGLSCHNRASSAAFEDTGRFVFQINSRVDVSREAFILANYYDRKLNKWKIISMK